ncbi:hypothetical protein [Bdellovibrio sp. HCB209]|uniref:hypothetical protein n=1 Tax=Bdellovibrio sp. HCB209 TaxID=3394354 RepID=UPI0039B3E20B
MNISKLLATAVLLSLAACAVKDDKASKVALRNSDGTPSGSAVLAGGQPGKVSISGALVDFDKEKETTTLKAGISSTFTPGKGKDGKPVEVVESEQLMLFPSQSDSTLASAESLTTFINLGCSEDKLDNTRTNGLTEAKAEVKGTESTTATAKVVFICGDISSSSISGVIKAHELILNNVHILSKHEVGSLDIGANKLVLIGQNKITTVGVDKATEVTEGPSLNLNVTKEFSGEGSLAITAVGANITSAAATATTEKEAVGSGAQQQAHDAQEEQNLALKLASETKR